MSKKIKILVILTPFACILVAVGTRSLIPVSIGANSSKQACINMMRQIDAAAQQFETTNQSSGNLTLKTNTTQKP